MAPSPLGVSQFHFNNEWAVLRTMCSFVTLFWPKKVKAAKLEEIHAKMVVKETNASTPRTSTDGASSSSKKRPGSNAKANGVPSSSKNGRYSR